MDTLGLIFFLAILGVVFAALWIFFLLRARPLPHQTLEEALSALEEDVDNVKLEIGEALLPVFERAANEISEMIDADS